MPPLVEQHGSFGVNKLGNNGGQGSTPGLGTSTGPDHVTGFDAGIRGAVKYVLGPMGLITPDNLSPAPPLYRQLFFLSVCGGRFVFTVPFHASHRVSRRRYRRTALVRASRARRRRQSTAYHQRAHWSWHTCGS